MASSIIRKDASNPASVAGHGAIVPMWMDREDLCHALGVSHRTLKRLIKRGAVERRISDHEARYRPLLSREAIRQLVEPDDLSTAPAPSPGVVIDGPRGAVVEALAELDFSDMGLDEASFESLDLRAESGAGFGPSTLDAAISIGEDRLRLVLEGDRVLFADATYPARDEAAQEREAASQEREVVEQTQIALQRAEQAIADQERAAAKIARLVQLRDRAIEANRALLNEHHRVAEERDGLLERSTALIEQRDDAIRHLARAVHQREQTSLQLDHAINQRDKVANQLDRVIDQRDATLKKLEIAVDQRATAVRHYEQARQILVDWKAWQQSAQQTLDQSEARALKAHQLALEALEVPWWNLSRRRQIREALKNL